MTGRTSASRLAGLGRSLGRSLELRMTDDVSRCNAEPGCRSASDFEYGTDRPVRWNDAFRHRLGIGFDAVHDAIGTNEHHVERDVGVAHPHADFARVIVGKQHAFRVVQLGPEHKPKGLLPGRICNFDFEGFRASLGLDGEDIQDNGRARRLDWRTQRKPGSGAQACEAKQGRPTGCPVRI